MKFLRSIWFVAVLALILNISTTTFLFLSYKNKIILLAKKQNTNQAVDDANVYWSFKTGEVENLSESLRMRSLALDQKAQKLDEIEQRIKAEIQELKRDQKNIEQAQASLSSKIVQIQQSEFKNIKTLATTYSAMTPTSAVAIMKELDDDLMVKILSQMKPEVTASIFDEMSRAPSGEPISKDGTMSKRAADLTSRLRLQSTAK